MCWRSFTLADCDCPRIGLVTGSSSVSAVDSAGPSEPPMPPMVPGGSPALIDPALAAAMYEKAAPRSCTAKMSEVSKRESKKYRPVTKVTP